MKVTLDGKNYETEVVSQTTLSGVIQKVERQISPERVIVALRLDGTSLDQESEKAKAAENIKNFESLDISTQSVSDLALNTLDNLVDFFPELIADLKNIVKQLQSGEEEKGHRNLGGVIDGLQITSAAMSGLSQTLNTGGLTPEELQSELDSFYFTLRQMLQSQENEDWVRLCDTMEYELIPQLENWQERAGNAKTTLAEI